MEDKPKSLYIDRPSGIDGVKADDFLVAIGKKQSNSVYHVAEVKSIKVRMDGRGRRYYLSVYKTELLMAIKREPHQQLIPIFWYSRKKKP